MCIIDQDPFLITEEQALEMYDEMLDEGGPVIISGIKFSPSVALLGLDPIAYKEGFSQYIDSLIESGYTVEGY